MVGSPASLATGLQVLDPGNSMMRLVRLPWVLRRRVVCRYVTCGILLTHRDGSASGQGDRIILKVLPSL
jgi:hypothetical protein